MRNYDIECHLLMHTACMSGNQHLWFMSLHDNFLESDLIPRTTMVDKKWGVDAGEPLHYSLTDHSIWKGVSGKSTNTYHQASKDEIVTWREHISKTYDAIESGHPDYNHLTEHDKKNWTKIACKTSILHNVKNALKDDIFDDLLVSVTPTTIYVVECMDRKHLDIVLERSNRLRGYGIDKERYLLMNQLDGQRKSISILKEICPVVEIDMGQLMFENSEDEYKKFYTAMNESPIDNWKEKLNEKTRLVYRY